MCVTCGCGDERGRDAVATRTRTTHARPAHAPATETLALEERVLAQQRPPGRRTSAAWLAGAGSAAVNLMSSPGSGKTSLLERTIAEPRPDREVCVIEGDQETARRRRADPARRSPRRPGQHRCRLPPRRRRWSQRALGALDPGDGLAAVRRERRQPGLPGAVRRRRARQGRGHLGDRGRRQAAEVPAHVRAPPTSWW